MMFLKLLIINLAVILIVDLSGFIHELKRFVSNKLTNNKLITDDYRLRPFDCSYCMTFWCLLIYILINQQFTFVNILLLILITHFTDVTKQVLLLIKDLAIKLINTVYERYI